MSSDVRDQWSHRNFNRSLALNLRVHAAAGLNDATYPVASPYLAGQIYFDTTAGGLRLWYQDGGAGGPANNGWQPVPRLDRGETLSGQWTFNPASPGAAPFVIGANGASYMVAGLNAQQLADANGTGRLAAQTAVGRSIAQRNADGTLTVQDGVADTDAANMRNVRNALEGIVPKGSVRAATTAALPTNTRSGNTLTAASNGALGAQDGVTLAANDLLLVLYEGGGGASYAGTSHVNNGPYLVTAIGSGSTPWVLTRAPNFDDPAEVVVGAKYFVDEGTVNINTEWCLIEDASNPTPQNPVLNADRLIFSKTDGNSLYGSGNGLDLQGATFAVKLSGSTTYATNRLLLADSPGTLAQLPAGGAGQVLHGNDAGAPTWGSVLLAADVSGILPIANGGTGAGALMGILKGNGASALTALTGTAGYLIKWSDPNTLSSASSLYEAGNGSVIIKNSSLADTVARVAVGSSAGSALTLIRNSADETGGLAIVNCAGGGYGSNVSIFARLLDGTTEYEAVRLQGVGGGAFANAASATMGLRILTLNAGALAECWRFTGAGVLQANGAQSINAGGGNLTLQSVANSVLFGTPNGTQVTVLPGGYIGVSSPAANDNLVLQAKGSGGVFFGYAAGSGGALIFDGGTANHGSYQWNSITASSGSFALNTAVVSQSGDITANSFAGSGGGLTGLNASQLASGTVPLSRLAGLTHSQLDAAAGIANAQLANSTLIVNTVAGIAGGAAVSLGAGVTLAIDQGFSPLWTGLHLFDPGATPTDAIGLDIAPLGSNGVRNSHNLHLTGRAYDGAAHRIDWLQFVSVRQNSGVSSFQFQNRIDGGGYASAFCIGDTGRIGIGAVTAPAYDLELDPGATRQIGMQRSSRGAGNSLHVYAGGCAPGGSNSNGGALRLHAGQATGAGQSRVEFHTSAKGGPGASDNPDTLQGWFDESGSLNVQSINPGCLVQTDANRNLIGANQLPAGVTMANPFAGTAALARITSFTLSGSHTSYALTHNYNTRNVQVSLYDTVTHDIADADFSAPTDDTIEIDFTFAPADGRFVATVVG